MTFTVLTICSVTAYHVNAIPTVLLCTLCGATNLIVSIVRTGSRINREVSCVKGSLVVRNVNSLLSFVLIFKFFGDLRNTLLLVAMIAVNVKIVCSCPESGQVSTVGLKVDQTGIETFLYDYLPVILNNVTTSTTPGVPERCLSCSFKSSTLNVCTSITTPITVVRVNTACVCGPLLNCLMRHCRSERGSFFSLVNGVLTNVFFINIVSSITLFFFNGLLLSLFCNTKVTGRASLLRPVLTYTFLANVT